MSEQLPGRDWICPKCSLHHHSPVCGEDKPMDPSRAIEDAARALADDIDRRLMADVYEALRKDGCE